jgi:hypothetical protein
VGGPERDVELDEHIDELETNQGAANNMAAQASFVHEFQ